jgi:hypothetical protein
MEFVAPWFEDRNPKLVAELRREVCQGHVLFGVPLSALARRQDCDDVLFSLNDGTGRFAKVHLTYSKESNPTWPHSTIFDNWEHWSLAMMADHNEFCS